MFFFSKKFPYFNRLPKVKIKGDGNAIDLSTMKNLGWRATICGNANRVECRGNEKDLAGKSTICIFGNSNLIQIEEGVCFSKIQLYIGTPDAPCNHGKIVIKKSTTFSGECEFRLIESNSEIVVGEDCMFSGGIQVWATDSHLVVDASGRKNIGKFVRVGNHVWVGQDAKIGKNVAIGDGSVVGWGSVVPAGIYPEKSIIAGVPAKVRKTGITWSRERPMNS